MQSFLDEVVTSVITKYKSLDKLVIVLPNRRAGVYLLQSFSQQLNSTVFAPKVISIDAFMEEVAELEYASNPDLLLELYQTYSRLPLPEKESFHDFIKWANILLQDFNEIDRHLIDPERIFTYLFSVQEIKTWYLEANRTQLITDYLEFWKLLGQIYENFKKELTAKEVGYQGMVYRRASDKAASFIQSSQEHYVFIGFNALTAAEIKTISTFLESSKAEIYWDIDTYFVNDPIHDAGYFVRQYLRNKPQLQVGKQIDFSNYYTSPKEIYIAGAPNNIAQAKYAGELLKSLSENNPDLTKTAVVLGDETLLNPLMNSIPKTIQDINITMGFPLDKTPAAGFFSQLFHLYSSVSSRGWYYGDLLTLLSHPFIQELSKDGGVRLSREIVSRNWAFLRPGSLRKLASDYEEELVVLFSEKSMHSGEFIEFCLEIISRLKSRFTDRNNQLALEYLYGFYSIFNQLKDAVTQNKFLSDLLSLQRLYEELLSLETVDFQGEPLQGLQLMGMLESRNIDFDTVIITSVNEGILPAGKSYNSFIPYDMKREFNLPSYKEKDAIYTYHFYRLIQRAKKVYLLYNTEPDVLEGGEKSRFITQLLTDPATSAYCEEQIIVPDPKPEPQMPQMIVKNPEMLEILRERAQSGLSPTTISLYVENPLEFYKKLVLNITEIEEIEEDVDARMMGNIIHNVMEKLYSPFVGKNLNKEAIEKMTSNMPGLVNSEFKTLFPSRDVASGKNLLALEIIKSYINTFLETEMHLLENNDIELLGVEKKMHVEVSVPGLDIPVVIKGTVDRIDRLNGKLRIIDYKTGTVDEAGLKVYDWELLKSEPKYSKALQLLAYALLANSHYEDEEMECGIITFKSLSKGLIKFNRTPKPGSRSLDPKVDGEVLDEFKKVLLELVSEIYAPAVPLEESEQL